MEYLVIDVGGTAIKYACMNENAEFLEEAKFLRQWTALTAIWRR